MLPLHQGHKFEVSAEAVRLELLSRDSPPGSTFVAEIDIRGRDLAIDLPNLPTPLVVRNPFANSQLFKADPSGRWLAILTRGWDGEATAVSVVGLSMGGVLSIIKLAEGSDSAS